MYNKDHKHYTIDNVNIHCSYKLKTENKHETEGNKLCKLIEKIDGKIIYNMSRVEKLANEYKCSFSYSFQESNDEKPMPNCNDRIYSEFEDKFKKVSNDIQLVKKQYSHGNFNLDNAKYYNMESIKSLSDLKQFTSHNIYKVNAAFDQAFYDTNMAGIANLFAFVFPPLGFAAMMNTVSYNNEFDGKISRAYDDAIEIDASLIEIGKLLSHHSYEIYG